MNNSKSIPKKKPSKSSSDNRLNTFKGPCSKTIAASYSKREIKPASNYDVVSFARAMNPDMGPKVKELFSSEKEAALEAVRSGVYVSWRVPGNTFDCQRVASDSRCFCGHSLHSHNVKLDNPNSAPCFTNACVCRRFRWVPSKPEEVGEYWLRKRRNFRESSWRAMCKCKHPHEDHSASFITKCSKCACADFKSAFLCAACDKHWEEHETYFEDDKQRHSQGLTTGTDFLPFSEIPSLRNMVLTGKDDKDATYITLQHSLRN